MLITYNHYNSPKDVGLLNNSLVMGRVVNTLLTLEGIKVLFQRIDWGQCSVSYGGWDHHPHSLLASPPNIYLSWFQSSYFFYYAF